jgi:hypothetical protein
VFAQGVHTFLLSSYCTHRLLPMPLGVGMQLSKIIIGRPPGVKLETNEDDSSDAAERFLLAEYSLVGSMRATTIRMVENRITLVTGLQASEIALVAVLITSKKIDIAAMLSIVCALGLPTLFSTYTVFLRSLDMQVTVRRYLHALNAIRGHFVDKYPDIRAAVRLPTDPSQPRFNSVGSHSSILTGYVVTMLVITASLSTILSASISWLALRASHVVSSEALFLVPLGAGIITCCVATAWMAAKTSRFLRRAEQLQ